ncbi:MAG: ribonuclease H-like domain-containing protein [Patescibacteria group bacterium]
MAKLVFDIETIGENYDKMDEATKEIMLKWLKKESYSDEEYQREVDAVKDNLGFSPLPGQIVAIGVLEVESEKGAVYYQNPDEPDAELEQDGVKLKAMSEKAMLEKFWEVASHAGECISFNGRAFDVPFILVRSAVHGIRAPINLMPPRYSSNASHIDLLDQLTFFGSVRKKGNLHMWCRAFGIKSPKADGISGDDVGKLFHDKEFLKIAEYNVGDLRATRELYQYWNDCMRF